MSILILVFAAVLIGIYGASYYETAKENLAMLQAYAAEFSLKNDLGSYQSNDVGPDMGNPILGEPKPRPGGRDFKDIRVYRLSSFYSVVISSDGNMMVVENGEEIYSNEELIEFAAKVNGNNENNGTLGNLMYYRADKGRYTLIAFLDNSITNNSLSALLKYTLVGGSVAIVVFLLISVKLAQMIVKPLEESYTKQKQFISDAGHELKTPISVVNANAELLSREIGDNPWLANIQYENERMGSLVTQLLDLARTENSIPQMEKLDFSRLVSGEALPFESIVYERGMQFVCEIQEQLTVYGNPTQLKQITAILLDNAVRHATDAGEIRLTLKKEHSHALLSVVNDGNEIPLSQRKNIFERFYRVDTARNDEDQHYGLGLAIAKAIVTTHKGKIDVHCYNGKVEFTIRIPLC